MKTYAEQVKEIYDEIFSLQTIEKQQAALHSWWNYLTNTCSKETPCIECLNAREESGA